MDEKKPTTSSIPSDPPPDYETAAAEHNSNNSSNSSQKPQQQTLPNRPRKPSLVAGAAALDLPILKYMRTHRVILASASPRRRALLAQVGLPDIEVRPSAKPEDLSKVSLGAYEYVSATAQQKALDVYAAAIEGGGEEVEGEETTTTKKNEKNGDPDLVISADTVIVTREGAVLEKPTSEAAHRRMLRHLRDTRVHRVLTAVCAVAPRTDASHPGYEIRTHIEETKVFFARAGDGLPDDVIDGYVRTREGVDKAGGYAVQGIGGMVLVERVEGSVDNVVGLPVRKCLQLCERVVFRQGEEDSEEEDDDELDG